MLHPEDPESVDKWLQELQEYEDAHKRPHGPWWELRQMMVHITVTVALAVAPTALLVLYLIVAYASLHIMVTVVVSVLAAISQIKCLPLGFLGFKMFVEDFRDWKRGAPVYRSRR